MLRKNVLLLILSVLFAASLHAEAARLTTFSLVVEKPTIVGPCYSSQARLSAEGLEDDYLYQIADGTVNPRENEVLLLLNGAFTADVQVVEQQGQYLLPLKAIVEVFGGEVQWQEEERQAIFAYGEHAIVVSVEQYGVARLCVNGSEQGLAHLIHDTIHVSLPFLSRHLGLDIGYLPSDATGLGIAHNPVLWIDRAGSYKTEGQDSGVAALQEKLRAALKMFREKQAYGHDDVANEIGADIDTLRYFGQAGRYALYLGPYVTLVDWETENVYFYHRGNAFGSISLADLNDPDLYLPGYVYG